MKITILFSLSSLFAFAKATTQQHGFRNESQRPSASVNASVSAIVRATASANDALSINLPRWLGGIAHQKYTGYGQYAVLYLHPADAGDTLWYTNLVVRDFMTKRRQHFTSPLEEHIYPPNTDNTNFAMVGFNRRLPKNFGHSEHLLLQQLVNMLTSFKGSKGDCPSHVVLYTLQAPCYWKSVSSSCTTNIVHHFKEARKTCGSKTTYVIGYRFVTTGKEQDWADAEKYFKNKAPFIVVTQTK